MPETQHDFERALDFLKGGYKIKRSGGQPGRFIWLTNERTAEKPDEDNWRLVDEEGDDVWISCDLLLAEDWEIIPLDWVPPE